MISQVCEASCTLPFLNKCGRLNWQSRFSTPSSDILCRYYNETASDTVDFNYTISFVKQSLLIPSQLCYCLVHFNWLYRRIGEEIQGEALSSYIVMHIENSVKLFNIIFILLKNETGLIGYAMIIRVRRYSPDNVNNANCHI